MDSSVKTWLEEHGFNQDIVNLFKKSELCQPSPSKRRPKRRQKQRTLVITPSPTEEDLSITETRTPESRDDTGSVHDYFQVMNKFGVGITCGECYRIEPGGLSVCIEKIKKSEGTYVADCVMIVSMKLDRQIGILVPVDRLVEDVVVFNRADRSSVTKAKKAAFWGSIQSGKDDGRIRSEQRTHQLALLIRKEVKLALASKASHRTFSLGLTDLVGDMELFKVDPFVHPRVEYSYLKGNFSDLDNILGHRWDVLDKGAATAFVTRVVVGLSKGVLSMRVYTSICHALIPNDHSYRIVLHDNISQSSSVDCVDEVELF